MRIRICLHALLITILLAGMGCTRKPARSDADIATDVQNRIYSDPQVQSRQIAVQAENGVVTLSGDVTSDAERTASASDAATVTGVRTVVNNLEVQQAEVAPPPPAPARPGPAPKPATKRERHADHKKPAAEKPPEPEMAANQPPDYAPPDTPPAATTPPPPQPPPPPKKVTVPAGTQLTIRLSQSLDSERNQVGDTFHASLSSPLVIDGETVIPIGSDVVGRVAEVRSAGRFAGNSVLTLELTSLSSNGKTYNIQTNQWTRSGKGEGKDTATKVGVGTAAGAILGGIIGGGRGAAIGAASGAGAGTGVAAAKKGQQIKLGPEAVLNFQMLNTLTVIPQAKRDRMPES